MLRSKELEKQFEAKKEERQNLQDSSVRKQRQIKCNEDSYEIIHKVYEASEQHTKETREKSKWVQFLIELFIYLFIRFFLYFIQNIIFSVSRCATIKIQANVREYRRDRKAN